MAKNHLKRLAAPVTWRIKKKCATFITKPNPGAHKQELCVPLSLLLKEMLNCASTTKEVNKLLQLNEVFVDSKRVKDYRFAVGLMDVVYIKPANQHYRVVFDESGRLSQVAISANEAKLKICRIRGKTPIKGGKLQINLDDSRNIILEKNDYNVGDSLMIELPSQKIMGYFKMEKGASILLIDGKHIADIGVLESINGKEIVYKGEKGEMLTTLKEYAFVVGKEKPAIKIR